MIDVIHEISVVKPLTFLSGEVEFYLNNNIHVQHDYSGYGWYIYFTSKLSRLRIRTSFFVKRFTLMKRSKYSI